MGKKKIKNDFKLIYPDNLSSYLLNIFNKRSINVIQWRVTIAIGFPTENDRSAESENNI